MNPLCQQEAGHSVVGMVEFMKQVGRVETCLVVEVASQLCLALKKREKLQEWLEIQVVKKPIPNKLKELNDLNVKELVNLKSQITNCQQDDPLSTSNRMTGVLANQLVRRRSDAHTKVCASCAGRCFAEPLLTCRRGI